MSRVGRGATVFHDGLTGPTGAGGRGAGCVNAGLVFVLGDGELGALFADNGERPFNVVDFNATPRGSPLDVALGAVLKPLVDLQFKRKYNYTTIQMKR